MNSCEENFLKIIFPCSQKKKIIIDTTAMPNQIHFPFNAWDIRIAKLTNRFKLLLFVIDSGSSLLLYFRYLPENVVDVSLNVTIEELRKFCVKSSFALIDAGFFSEDNITRLFAERIDFLTRLPSNRTLYSELVELEMPDMSRLKMQ